jgi:hypothetical protein
MAVNRRIVYGRYGALSFPNRKTTLGSSQIGRILSLETLLVMDNPNGDRNIKIICNF